MTATARRNFDAFLEEVLADPAARAAFEDSQSRNRLVDALVRMRSRLGMSQKQVAERMGVKQPTVSGFENEGSDPRLSTLQRYARSVDAVLVWDVRPRLDVARADIYHERSIRVHMGVNHAEPTTRAKSWTPKKPYHLHAVA